MFDLLERIVISDNNNDISLSTIKELGYFLKTQTLNLYPISIIYHNDNLRWDYFYDLISVLLSENDNLNIDLQINISNELTPKDILFLKKVARKIVVAKRGTPDLSDNEIIILSNKERNSVNLSIDENSVDYILDWIDFYKKINVPQSHSLKLGTDNHREYFEKLSKLFNDIIKQDGHPGFFKKYYNSDTYNENPYFSLELDGKCLTSTLLDENEYLVDLQLRHIKHENFEKAIQGFKEDFLSKREHGNFCVPPNKNRRTKEDAQLFIDVMKMIALFEERK